VWTGSSEWQQIVRIMKEVNNVREMRLSGALRWFRGTRLTGAFPLLLFAQQAPPPASFLLKGGTIHTISGPVIENGSILVRDGKIIGVGHNLAAPEGVPVIDVTG
jgi:hypothetical protein